MAKPEFCFAQVRLQARNGVRPGMADWKVLEGARSLAHYLERTRSGGLARFTDRIGAGDDGHMIELRLREARRAYVGEVAGWAPPGWQAAVHWCAVLPELPLVAFLLQGGEAWPWMAADPFIAPLAVGPVASRRERLAEMRLATLAPADRPVGGNADGLDRAWLDRWKALWPVCPADERAHLDRLIAAVARSSRLSTEVETGTPAALLRGALVTRLSALFRAASPGPAALFCHLALVALDIERLRGGMMRRRLLGPDMAESA